MGGAHEVKGKSDLRDDLVGRDAAAQGLRRAMANFATGITIVTCVRDGVSYAMTCNSFTSISLAPPLVMVSASQKGQFYEHFTAVERWAVSVLANGQGAIARHFADASRDRLRQFEEIPHRISELTGAPLVEGALAWLECATERQVPAGDHTIVLGAVLGAEVRAVADARPLTYFQGGFLELPSPS